ncbi:MAG: NAD(P)H-quinone oxidoreductase subunit 3 [bacterium]|nr:NAD(P)H-quinone oxidoreductase subunit 3 [bacterium]MCP5044249.1 NAD(P)H-quinone oxidoreductase subunit 3 [bacterium]
MSDQYLGLVAMLAVGAAVALGIRALARRLRRKIAEVEPEAVAQPPQSSSSARTSRYFFLAVVGFMLHLGSFYFYLWGASAQSVGLAGLMVMLGVGMCLIVGVFYSWARGAVSYAIESEGDIRAD